MHLAAVAITTGGKAMARSIAEGLDNCVLLDCTGGVRTTLADNWKAYDGFICVMATGIVIRSIAGLLVDKRLDPCVIVLDEQGRHVISLLSGHLGGGNNLAKKIATITGGTAVITTASDTRQLAPLDLWAAGQNLIATDSNTLTRLSAQLVNSGCLFLATDLACDALPSGLVLAEKPSQANLFISYKHDPADRATADLPRLCPRILHVGIGCNRGTPVAEFEEAFTSLFTEEGLSPQAVRALASIDAKQDEEGLLHFAENHKLPIRFFSAEEINRVENVTISQAARRAVGAIGVAEPTALLSAQSTQLICRKKKWSNITMAVAAADFTLSARVLDPLTT